MVAENSWRLTQRLKFATEQHFTHDSKINVSLEKKNTYTQKEDYTNLTEM